MKCATLVTLLCASTRRRPIKPLRSSGVAFSKQELGGLPRSSGKISLVTPCSTRYASAANRSNDLVCAFHPNRVIPPSRASRFGRPSIPNLAFAFL